MTRIYTRSGDGGETSLGDGSRVPKSAPRVATYGDVDELGAVLGCAVAALAHGAAPAGGFGHGAGSLTTRRFEVRSR